MMTMTRNRRTTTHVADRGVLRGSGSTKAEAKADLERQIDNALTDDHDPALVSYDGETFVVYRTPWGWCYQRIETKQVTDGGIVDIHWSSLEGLRSRQEVIQAVSHHAIQISPKSRDFHEDSDIPSFLTDKDMREDLLRHAQFHRAYQHAKSTMPDKDSNVWHHWACQHSRDDQFR